MISWSFSIRIALTRLDARASSSQTIPQPSPTALLGILFVSSILVVAANLAVDLLDGILDPRMAT